MRRLLGVLAACAALAGCGYVGEPLPPALNIATPIRDLRAIEYGGSLLIDFTIPQLTTEGLPMRKISAIDLRIGAAENPFDGARWAEAAAKIPVSKIEPGPAQAVLPAGAWTGKEVVVGVRVINTKGRASEWSNWSVLRVVPPVAKPEAVQAVNDPLGVKLTWNSAAPQFRVYRRGPGDTKPALLDSPTAGSYIDKSVELGKRYEYLVQAVAGSAESEVSETAGITPRDIFPPQAPAGVNAVAGIGSVELVWDRNTEPDLKGYRVYRALESGEFTLLAEFADTPAYSDRRVESGKKYRYAVTAVDQAGNESPRSAAAEVTVP